MQTSGNLRTSGVAGRFFAGAPDALNREVATLLHQAGALAPVGPSAPRAVISPHAGYAFSGRLTAAALLATRHSRPDRIAILSPAHRHAFDGIALPSQSGYALPGMTLPIDHAARAALLAKGLVHVLDAAHDMEHGIETQLPFLQALHGQTPLVPLVIGRAGSADVAEVIDTLTGCLPGNTLFVLSSDLSHFLTLDQATDRDRATARRIETGDHARLGPQDACGARAIAGYLASRSGAGARALRLAMTSSHATTGDAARVVGYGAWRLHGGEDPILDDAQRDGLLHLARTAIERQAAGEPVQEPDLDELSAGLQGHAASFVTLQTRAGALRGCIGSLAPHAPLARDVAANAVKAGFSDPRFVPVTADELPGVSIKLSVLGRPASTGTTSEDAALSALVPGRSGAILTDGRHRGLFLPQVWESLPEPREFLRGLRRKAGLPPDYWSDRLDLQVFHAESFGEAA